jgi:hypothetical protein
VALIGTVANGSYPATVRIGSVSTPYDSIVVLNDVKGLTSNTAVSYTTVRTKVDNTPFTYDNFLILPGYVNVDKSESERRVIIAQGNIGSNVH